jgi:hypothetical protein
MFHFNSYLELSYTYNHVICFEILLNNYPNKGAYFTMSMNISENKDPKPEEYGHSSRDAICTCKTCNHEIARDCLKSDCNCCKDHSMIMDGIEGFVSTSKKHEPVEDII